MPTWWLASSFALGLLWTRGERALGQDSFSFLEMAKAFAQQPPDKFGDWWPYGYPVAGALLTLIRFSPYGALLFVTLASFLYMFTMVWRLLPAASQAQAGTVLVITAFAWAPVTTQLMVFNLSDPPMAAALFGLAVSLAHWPQRWAIATSLAMALLAFSARYAGVFAFGVVGLYALLHWRTLREARAVGFLVGAATVVLGITGGLLWSNFRAFGRITGPQPVGEETLWSWPFHLAHLGWSVPAAFTSSHLVSRIDGVNPLVVYAGGFAMIALVAALLWVSWVRPPSSYARPAALVAGSYLLTIVTLRASTPFPSLYFPRYLFPAFLLLLYLLVLQSRLMRSRLTVAAACATLVVGGALAVRGISPNQRPDLAAARAFLQQTLRPGDVVAVNLTAINLAAHFDNRFDYIGDHDGYANAWRISPTNWQPARTTFTALATRPAGPAGTWAFDRGELDAVMTAVAAGLVDVVYRGPGAMIVKAREPRTETQ